MSYTLSAYAIDLKNLRDTVGEADEKLQKKIIRSNPDEFDDEDDFDPGSGRVPLATALENLLAGKASLSDDYAQHAYALEELCRFLAKKDWNGYILDSQKQSITRFLDNPPTQLPGSTGLPSIGTIESDELPRIVDSIKEQWEIADDGELEEDASEIIEVFKFAQKKRLGVVLVWG
ncbi:DUF7691 family protein [Bremerella alba]|uniref:DUF7691 domain-containing protein n=1 Tax=Bremerella alba TaxID=980252 RepID=A0A7V9A9U7_9BACT|nr:hypothetical protein [Bremerella alba]MBA2117713.1 hypothetical protein [Bremerella alba]